MVLTLRRWLPLLVAGLAARPAAAATLPHVGFLESVDPAARQLVLRGPDGTALSVTLGDPGVVSDPTGTVIPFDRLAGWIGKPAAVRLARPGVAFAVIELTGIDPEPERGEVVGVDRKRQEVQVLAADGMPLALTPAVNLAAVAAAGEKPQAASWDWFEAHLRQPFFFHLIRVHGKRHIWSVQPWPRAGAQPAAPTPPEATAEPTPAPTAQPTPGTPAP
jgi:hypothetical protein